MPRPATGQPKRMLEGADKEFDADIRRLLENTTVGFKYQLPTADDRNPEGTEEYVTRLYEFMVAESYIVQVTGGYLLTASGREYRKHLQANLMEKGTAQSLLPTHRIRTRVPEASTAQLRGAMVAFQPPMGDT